MSNYILDPQTILFRLALAFFLGILIGIDRDEGWRPREPINRQPRFSFLKPGRPAIGLGGVRTYTLLSVLGFFLGTLYLVDIRTLPIVILGALGIISYISIAYFLNFFDRHTLGLTTEIGMLILLVLSFALGADLLDYKLIFGIAVLVSLVAGLKVELRKIIGSFTKKEIIESLEFVAISGVILPWLPNINITLGQISSYLNIGLNNPAFNDLVIINPFQFWTVIVFISALNFTGYFLAKVLQSSSSLLVTAFLGGIVSSTSTTEFLAQRSHAVKTANGNRFLAAAVLIANMTSFIRIPLIALVVNPIVFWEIAPSLLILTIATLIIAYFFQRSSQKNEQVNSVFRSPLALKPALLFGFLFLFVSLLTKIGQMFLGSTGFVVTAIVASFSGLDAVTIVTSNAVKASTIPLVVGASVILGAVITNLLFKLILIGVSGSKQFKRYTLLSLTGISIFGLGLLAFLIW